MGITHFDEARKIDYALGHLTSSWTLLGESAGSVNVGVRRIQIPAGRWSTPAHEHGIEEELFYVLSGSGISWQGGRTAPIAAGDCILYAPRRGAHSIHATDAVDVLAFGNRCYDEAPRFPRLDYSLVNGRAIPSSPSVIERAPFQFVKESELGPPALPELPAEIGERPASIVNVQAVQSRTIDRGRTSAVRRDLGRAVGSRSTGLKHAVIAPGMESSPPHCHSVEEELFVVLDGSGTVVLGHGDGAEELELRAGNVVSRPAGTGIAHCFLAGPDGLTALAYGTREPSDLCYYPRSNKISFRGIGVIGRIERLDYSDGED
ncbi:MAG: cupin domain-containing protein [Solirubrobacteraceae bacterium]